MTSPDETQPSGNGGQKELRLAVVCYGGSSLAIYMHGVTKELHRLVKGSALLDAGIEPAPDAKSEAVYRDLLDALAGEQHLQTRVVVDVVAGTSAGGINGVFLSKAVAHNLSQDQLRDVWFNRGDMRQLLRWPKWIPYYLRFLMLLPSAVKKSPLRGNEMAQWLFTALQEMDAEGSRPQELPTLVPRDGRLDLFVTITDFYGYDRQIPIADPLLVHDQRHRHALTFSYEPGEVDEFRGRNNGSLAFAARATSCFPGVFPPVSFGAFREWVPEAQLDDLARCFRSYDLAGTSAERTQFVDGGVLDNKPFGWAIGALTKRRANVEVERRLLYLEPDPGERVLAENGAPKPAPGTLPAIMGAVTGLPRHEPILDDLLAVRVHNNRVQRIRDVVETSFDGVGEFVESVVGPAEQIPDDAESAKLAEWSTKINERTIAESGLAYATYLRLKISSAVDRYATAVCNVRDFPDDSNHAQLVRAVLRRWGDERQLFVREAQPNDAQRTFLRELDLAYGERRLRFVTSALRWWYRDLREGKPNIPSREDLDRGKAALYDAVDYLRTAMDGAAFPDALQEKIGACFPDAVVLDFLGTSGLDADAYLEAHRADLEAAESDLRVYVASRLSGFSAGLYRDLNALSKNWHPDRRRDLLVRYLGFPLWDVLLYPIQALADAGENDEVKVHRLSPYEAQVLPTPPADKVQGKRLMHFGAFFDRKARENDYLWGRLDGAANLIAILLGRQHPDYDAWCRKAFAAIFAEDEQALSHIPDTVRELRAEAART